MLREAISRNDHPGTTKIKTTKETGNCDGVEEDRRFFRIQSLWIRFVFVSPPSPPVCCWSVSFSLCFHFTSYLPALPRKETTLPTPPFQWDKQVTSSVASSSVNMTRVLLLLVLTRLVAIRRLTNLSLLLRNVAGQHFDSRSASVYGRAWTFNFFGGEHAAG